MDTIVMKFNRESFRILNSAQFLPEYKERNFEDVTEYEKRMAKRGKRYLRKFILDLDKDITNNEYFPTVELYENVNLENSIVTLTLSIKFSIPKLIYGNNIEEIIESDYLDILKQLRIRLEKIGIVVSEYSISNAKVSVVHFCKNILLPSNILFHALFLKLSRVDLGKVYETTEDTRLRIKNKSEVLHIRAGCREWSIYDKSQDLIRKVVNKREDKEVSSFEEGLKNIYNLEKIQIFRYEYRLNKIQTINSELNKILGRDYKIPVIFKDLFFKDLFKNVLISSWNRIFDQPKNLFAQIDPENKMEVFTHILKTTHDTNPKVYGQNKALCYYAIASGAIDFGAKPFNAEINKFWSSKPERFNEKVEVVAEIIKKKGIYSEISFLSKELNDFKRVTLDSLPKRI